MTITVTGIETIEVSDPGGICGREALRKLGEKVVPRPVSPGPGIPIPITPQVTTPFTRPSKIPWGDYRDYRRKEWTTCTLSQRRVPAKTLRQEDTQQPWLRI